MAIDNQEMYDSARAKSEPEFIKALKHYGFTNVKQSSIVEDKDHTDIFATFNRNEFQFDVKDLTAKYRTSRRYHISTYMMNDIKQNTGKYKMHFVACKEYKNSMPTGKFIVVKTIDAASIAKLYNRHDNGKPFYLFDIDECMEKFDYRLI